MGQYDASKDYYSILGAAEDAPPDEIERQYKRSAIRHHPDRGGDEERMKDLNEAYDVLRDEGRRGAYDAERQRPASSLAFTPRTSPAAQADAIGGRFAGAALCLALGLFLLLLVRFQWIWFLFPLGLLGTVVMGAGVLMAHTALAFLRGSYAPRHLARRTAWAQEILFWSIVGGGVYGLYALLTL